MSRYLKAHLFNNRWVPFIDDKDQFERARFTPSPTNDMRWGPIRVQTHVDTVGRSMSLRGPNPHRVLTQGLERVDLFHFTAWVRGREASGYNKLVSEMGDAGADDARWRHPTIAAPGSGDIRPRKLSYKSSFRLPIADAPRVA